MRPDIEDVRIFCKELLWDRILAGVYGDRLNLRLAIAEHLKTCGVGTMLAEEFAERQLGLACSHVYEVIQDWDHLGVPSPAHLQSQDGVLLTWKHKNFVALTEHVALSENFPYFWEAIRKAPPTELLFYLAGYLYCIECDSIYITDKSGDGGIDLIGLKTQGALKGLCLLVQSKSAENFVKKDSFLCDYSKSILSEKTGRWKKYADDIGLSRNRDGYSKAFIFASNREYGESIQDAARELGITLRSGKQIAHTLSCHFTPAVFKGIRDRVASIEASTKRDYRNIFSGKA